MSGATESVGRRNVLWGWAVISLGAVFGSILMAWSFAGPFSPPPGFHDYGDLPRRMTRLAHIALFMLPIINILIGKDLDEIAASRLWKEICSWSAIVAMIGIPSGLLAGALINIHLKYISFIPVNALLLALTIMGVGFFRRERHRLERG